MLSEFLDSKFFLGMVMIMMNLWGRHIIDEISVSEEEYRRNIVLRRIAIFAICYAATRDLLVSFSLTAGFIIMAMGISRRGQEGMQNIDPSLSRSAGMSRDVEQPAYDASAKLLFNN